MIGHEDFFFYLVEEESEKLVLGFMMFASYTYRWRDFEVLWREREREISILEGNRLKLWIFLWAFTGLGLENFGGNLVGPPLTTCLVRRK